MLRTRAERRALPPAIEDELVAVLDSTPQARDGALRELRSRSPEYEGLIQRWLAIANERPSDLCGPFRKLRTIGKGGMGEVFEAEEISTGTHVALKQMKLQYVRDPELIQRFQQEGRLASALVHPRCVFVFKAGVHGGYPYIAMELMPGRTLQDILDERGRLSLEVALPYIFDLLDGLLAAHRLGIVHRDVKPGNCFLDHDGRVKVGDFGLAKTLDADLCLTRGGYFGTPLFAAPEQLRGKDVDYSADVYSVACTLYYLLTLRWPHEGSTYEDFVARVFSDLPTPIRTYREDLPAAFDKVLARGLARSTSDRYQDLAQLKDALMPFHLGGLRSASLQARLTAFVLDLALLLTALFCVRQFGMILWSVPASIAAWFTCNVISDKLCSASPGKLLMRLRITRRSALAAPTLSMALNREMMKCFAVVPPLMPAYVAAPTMTCWMTGVIAATLLLAPAIIPRRNRSWQAPLQDLLSDTRVVERMRTDPSVIAYHTK